MKVLVTGCNGYIGSVLTKKLLLRKDMEVVGIGLQDKSSIKGIEYYKKDIRTAEADFVSQFDIIYHLAAQADIPLSFKDPDYTWDVNVNGTKNLVKNFGGRRFVFASSGSVLEPKNPYAKSKLEGEKIVKKVPYTILRYFNVYGWGKGGLVVQAFLKNALENKPLILHGDGEQTRDFIHLEDVVDATIATSLHPNALNQTFDVGTGAQTSLLELIKIIEELLGRELEVKHDQKRPGDPDTSVADLKPILKKTGWGPRISLKEGIRRMVDESKRTTA